MAPFRTIPAVVLAVQIVAGEVERAEAADPAEVETLIRQGVELRQHRDDQRALPLFQKAYTIAPTPRTAAQLGLAEVALGYVIDAERHLQESLAATHDPWVKKNRTVLETTLRRVQARIGQVVVGGRPKDAEVRLNGTVVGRLPLATPLRVGEGPANVEVEARGYKKARYSLAVTGGRQTAVDVELEAEPAVLTPPPGSNQQLPTLAATHARVPADAVAGGGSSRLEPPPVAVAQGESPADAEGAPNTGASVARPAAWVLATGAAAGLGFGIFETLSWSKAKSEFENHTKIGAQPQRPAVHDCGTSVPGHGGPGCDALYESASHAKNLLILGYAVGGALAIGSAVLFIVSAPVEPETSRALACLPFAGLGASCRLSF
jgi:hypothetical protein